MSAGKKILNRLTPVIASVLILVILEQVLIYPKALYALAILLAFVPLIAIWQLSGRIIFNKKFWQFSITPFFLVLSGLLFLSFLQGYFTKQFFLVALVIFFWTYLEVTYFWFHFRAKYQAHALENITTHLNLFTIFLISVSFFNLDIFLPIVFWPLVVVFTVVAALLTYQLVWASGASLISGLPYIIVITLTVSELLVAVTFLPTSVYVNGMIVTLGYYITSGLSRNWLLEIRHTNVLWRYAGITAGVLVCILVTAKWF